MIVKARVNTYALRQTSFNSAALGVLGSIAHPVDGEGVYGGSVFHDRIQVGEFTLRVDPEVSETQATIDLAQCRGPARARGDVMDRVFSVNPKGYLMLYVSEGPGGFSVELATSDRKKPRVMFNSRVLRAGDLFIATLIRPGTYQAGNARAKGKAAISVALPELGEKPFEPPEPARIKCTRGGFDPKKANVYSAQGVIFQIDTSSAIKVDLTKAPPEKKPRARATVRWRKPSPRPRKTLRPGARAKR